LILQAGKKTQEKMSPKMLTFAQKKRKISWQKHIFYASKEFRGKKILLMNAAGQSARPGADRSAAGRTRTRRRPAPLPGSVPARRAPRDWSCSGTALPPAHPAPGVRRSCADQHRCPGPRQPRAPRGRCTPRTNPRSLNARQNRRSLRRAPADATGPRRLPRVKPRVGSVRRGWRQGLLRERLPRRGVLTQQPPLSESRQRCRSPSR